jgi:hypothetical protein
MQKIKKETESVGDSNSKDAKTSNYSKQSATQKQASECHKKPSK